MTTGPENYGNGGANSDDRFAAQLSGYRPASRDSGAVLPINNRDGDDVGRRNGSVPTIHRVNGSLDMANPIASSMRAPQLAEPELDDSDRWYGDIPSDSLADHPLLRGLLLELPPKGSMPPQEWLDRWFEAARSILELLYAQHAGRR
jgi:hypothetical protein